MHFWARMELAALRDLSVFAIWIANWSSAEGSGSSVGDACSVLQAGFFWMLLVRLVRGVAMAAAGRFKMVIFGSDPSSSKSSVHYSLLPSIIHTFIRSLLSHSYLH